MTCPVSSLRGANLPRVPGSGGGHCAYASTPSGTVTQIASASRKEHTRARNPRNRPPTGPPCTWHVHVTLSILDHTLRVIDGWGMGPVQAWVFRCRAAVESGVRHRLTGWLPWTCRCRAVAAEWRRTWGCPTWRGLSRWAAFRCGSSTPAWPAARSRCLRHCGGVPNCCPTPAQAWVSALTWGVAARGWSRDQDRPRGWDPAKYRDRPRDRDPALGRDRAED